MEPPVVDASIIEVKNDNENLVIKEEEEKKVSSEKNQNQSWKDKFKKRATKGVRKLKKGVKVGAQKTLNFIKKGKTSRKDIKEGIKKGASKIKKGSKMGLEKLQEEFWIGVEIFKEAAKIGIEKLKRASIFGSHLAQNSIKYAKQNAKVVKKRLLVLKSKVKEDVNKASKKMKKFKGKVKLKYEKGVKGLHALKDRVKIKRVNFCVWFMYNCHTMKLLCLECWMIENPQIIMKNIKKYDSSCATLLPCGYGAIIYKSLILTPFQYINDSKKALQGEVLIRFGDQKPHSPAASCIPSDVEIERGQAYFTLEHVTHQNKSKIDVESTNESKLGLKCGSSSSSKQASLGQSPKSSKQVSLSQSPKSSKHEILQASSKSSKERSLRASPTSSNLCSRIVSKSVSKTASRAGTPPSTPKKQHTHQLLPSRIFLCNEALDLTLLTCDPLPKSMVPLGLGKTRKGRNMDLYRRVYILGYTKQPNGTTSSLSIGMGRIIDMEKLHIKFATLVDSWFPGSIGFDERGNFAFIVCNPQNIKSSLLEQDNVDDPPRNETPNIVDQPQQLSVAKEPSNFENSRGNDKFHSMKEPLNFQFGPKKYTLSHRSAFGIRRYEIEDYEFGPKYELKETIEHLGIVVQGIRQWIVQHWEGISFDKLIPPLGWGSPLVEPIPLEYDSHTYPINIKQKWCSDFNKPPTYKEMTLFMNVYNRLAALRRECSKAQKEHTNLKSQHLSSITNQQCLDEVAHGTNLVNPRCSKFRRGRIVERTPPHNPIRKTSVAFRRALAHKIGHRDPSKPKLKRQSKNSCHGCM